MPAGYKRCRSTHRVLAPDQALARTARAAAISSRTSAQFAGLPAQRDERRRPAAAGSDRHRLIAELLLELPVGQRPVDVAERLLDEPA